MPIKSADQITIIDVTDAYSVMLTSETYTFIGNTNGVAVGASCETEAVAFCGTNQCSSVSVNKDNVVCPTGITAAISNNGTSKVKVTFTTNAVISTACEATIPVVVDGVTVNKKFSFAVALKGATGDTGATGKGIVSVTNYYLASASATGVDTSTAGWTTTMQTTDTNKKYLWCYQTITYTSGDPTKTTPVIIGTHGATGGKGDDAITLTITASNGTVFKNSLGITILTAHVFKGAVEQTITDAGVVSNGLGTIKWYKGSGTTAVSTSKTYEVKASAVDNSEVFTCQLE